MSSQLDTQLIINYLWFSPKLSFLSMNNSFTNQVDNQYKLLAFVYKSASLILVMLILNHRQQQ